MNKQHYLKGLIVIIFLEIIVYREVQCRRIQDADESNFGSLDFQKIFDAISRTKETNVPSILHNRKSGGYKELELKHLVSVVKDAETLKQWLREDSDTKAEVPANKPIKDDLAVIIENELMHALSKKTPVIFDRPYLQKKGRNDFLVLRPDIHDPFVTIVPNDIYYNVEKKCINWLDDCNKRGLRNRLLQRVNYPF